VCSLYTHFSGEESLLTVCLLLGYESDPPTTLDFAGRPDNGDSTLG
jgi:hypothetical protein